MGYGKDSSDNRSPQRSAGQSEQRAQRFPDRAL